MPEAPSKGRVAREMATLAGHRCRVFLDGRDISRLVNRCDISYAVNSIVTTTLTLFDSPRIDDDGTIHLGIEPLPIVPVELPMDDDRPLRAILLRRDDEA
jgi:hypothetical protein